MWGLKSPPFLGSITPRLGQSAVRLRNRWLQRRGAEAGQPYEPKGSVDVASAVSGPASAMRRPRDAHRDARRATSPVSAAAAAAAAPLLANSSNPTATINGSEQDLAVHLDYVPSLGPLREVLCVLAPTLLVTVMYVATGRWHGGSWVARVASVVAAAACVSLTRNAWMEREYKARERAHAALGDCDSHFRSITTAATGRSQRRQRSPHSQPLVVHVKVKVGDVAQQRSEQAEFLGATGDSGAAALQDDSSGSSDVAGGTDAARDGGSLCAVHCYHGFGANLGSYKRVQDEMAAVLRGVVTSHDMPGFGLTQRPSDMSSYFLTFNGRLGRLVMDYELQQLGLLPPDAAADGPSHGSSGQLPAGAGGSSTLAVPAAAATSAAGAGDSSEAGEVVVTVGPVDDTAAGSGASQAQGGPQPQRPQQHQRAIKRILVGHSLGGACAALEAVTDPSGLAGLVLVAPAIFAIPGPEYQQVTLSTDRPDGGAAAAEEQQRTATARAAANLGSEPPGSHVTDPPEVRRLYPVGPMPGSGAAAADSGGSRRQPRPGRLLRAVRSLVGALASLALLAVLKLLTPIITLLLRSLVRRRTFWIKGLQQAYYNPAGVTPDIVDSYRMPQLVTGWEAGMVNFLLARLARPRGGLGELFRDALQGGASTAAASSTPGIAAAAPPSNAETEAGVALPSSSPSTPLLMLEAERRGGGDADDDGDLATRLASLLSGRNMPVLIIHGLYDKLVPASNSQRLARMLPGCELILLDRCGHMPQEEMPALFVNLVAEFCARVSPSGAGEELKNVAGDGIPVS